MAKKLSGQTLMVTGTLKGYSGAEAKKEIEALGGKVSGGVSANTNCVKSCNSTLPRVFPGEYIVGM